MDGTEHQGSVDSVRIAIAGGDSASRYALQVLLEERLNATVLNGSPTLENLNSLTVNDRPNIILIDSDILDGDMAQLVTDLGTIEPRPSVIVLSMHTDVAMTAEKAGADAFVNKTELPQRLLSAIERMRIRGRHV